MDKSKEKWKKWLYWFSLGIAIIAVYKMLDSFPDVMGSVNKFFSIISPFLVGVFIAYLLYVPCRNIENILKKSKIKIVSNKSRVLSVFTVYIIAILILIILMNFILPVIIDSIVDLINNIQGYYETAMDTYNNLPEESFFKSSVVKDAIQNVQDMLHLTSRII